MMGAGERRAKALSVQGGESRGKSHRNAMGAKHAKEFERGKWEREGRATG